MTTSILTLRALQDNYVYLVHRQDSPKCWVVDPSVAEPVNAELKAKNLTLELILNTHHHWDHIGGDEALKSQWHAQIYCSVVDQTRIPWADKGLRDGDEFVFHGIRVQTLAIPGHTKGQVAYWIKESNALFVGDTVFAMGCGRLFEGSAEEMWASLQKIAALPPETRLFVGHEYTERNAAFAREVEPDNTRILERLDTVRKELSERGVANPPTLKTELETNPFFRPHSPSIRRTLGMPSASDVEVFAKLRELRNSF